MDPHCGSFFSYHHSSSWDYVALVYIGKYNIGRYVTKPVQLGREVIEKRDVFHITGIRERLHSLRQNHRPPG